MSTAGLVTTVTDELLEELEEAASNATQDAWELLPGTNLSGPEIIANGESIAWVLDSEADAVHIATANPATIAALTAELRRLRAENAELAKDAGRYRFVRELAWYVDRASYIYQLGNHAPSNTPWSDLRVSVDADDVEAAIDSAMNPK